MEKPNREPSNAWPFIIIFLIAGGFLWVFSRAIDAPTVVVQANVPPVEVIIPTATATWWVETSTPLPTQTPWVVTPSPTSESALPRCDHVSLGEPCRIFVPKRADPTQTPLSACEDLTPVAGKESYTFFCRKTNKLGTTGSYEVGNVNGIEVFVTATENPCLQYYTNC